MFPVCFLQMSRQTTLLKRVCSAEAREACLRCGDQGPHVSLVWSEGAREALAPARCVLGDAVPLGSTRWECSLVHEQLATALLSQRALEEP